MSTATTAAQSTPSPALLTFANISLPFYYLPQWQPANKPYAASTKENALTSKSTATPKAYKSTLAAPHNLGTLPFLLNSLTPPFSPLTLTPMSTLTTTTTQKLTVVALAILKETTREIEICLSNGQRVKAYGSNGGYIQYGANENGISEALSAYQLTQTIAQRWAKWLNGGSPSTAPKPSKRYTEYQDLHAYEQATAEYNGPIISLTCCCCGDNTKGRQWHNRDTGYGICPKCVAWIAGRETAEEMQKLYGAAGIHHSI